MIDQPLVSVSIITYNQADLIGRALDSVLMQEVDFPYEIIVGDDCSNDGTQEVLRDYQRRYPDRIVLILHPRRYQNEVPGRTNNATNLCACRGKYTAMLDGDDYWLDPHKLQRQVDYLEAHPEIGAYLHDSLEVNQVPDLNESAGPRYVSQRGTPRPTGVYGIEEFGRPHEVMSIQISSLVFRTRLFEYFPDWFYEIVGADTAIFWLLAQRADFYYEAVARSAYWIGRHGMMADYLSHKSYVHRMLDDVAHYERAFPELTNLGYFKFRRSMYSFTLLKKERTEKAYLKACRSALHVLTSDPHYFAQRVRSGSSRLIKSLLKSAAIFS